MEPEHVNRFCAALIFTWVLCGAAYSQSIEGYLCIADKATGFKLIESTKTWDFARFNVTDNKFLLSKSATEWRWKKFGDENGMRCDDFNEYGYMFCEGFFGAGLLGPFKIAFNRKNLRYIRTYRGDYINAGIAGLEGEDAPFIEIGRCSKM